MNQRRLSLKREVLQELSPADLGAVAGATGSVGRVCVVTIDTCVAETMYSCMTYISCAMLHTCWAPDSVLCIQTG